jgi:hypothetical protein
MLLIVTVCDMIPDIILVWDWRKPGSERQEASTWRITVKTEIAPGAREIPCQYRSRGEEL